jgi:Leucine-rich repeat (LRR) protein
MKKLAALTLLCSILPAHGMTGLGKMLKPGFDYKLPEKNNWSLDLSKKNLGTIITLDIVPGIEKIKKIDISGNNLSSLSPDLFKKFIALEEVNLANNRLTSLPKTIFSTNKKLRKVIFIGNNLDEQTKNYVAPFIEKPIPQTIVNPPTAKEKLKKELKEITDWLDLFSQQPAYKLEDSDKEEAKIKEKRRNEITAELSKKN